MPFPFVYVCDLLEDLDRLHIRENPLLPSDLRSRTTSRINKWLQDHKFGLNAFNTHDKAVLWILRPDKLTDREHGISVDNLEQIVARIYQLWSEEYLKLQKWRTHPHLGDLASCVEVVRRNMKVPSLTKKDMVTVEDIQNSLLRIASFHPDSSLAVQSLAKFSPKGAIRIDLLGELYNKLQGREAKWLTRFILKDYRAVLVPDSWAVESGHLDMPNIAGLRLNLFAGPPPVPSILEGTQMLEGIEDAAIPSSSNVNHSSVSVTEKGWPRRTIVRSREASPISPPAFARGILKPDPNFHPILELGEEFSKRIHASKFTISETTGSDPAISSIASQPNPEVRDPQTKSNLLPSLPPLSSRQITPRRGEEIPVAIDLERSSPIPSSSRSMLPSSNTAITTPPRNALSPLSSNSFLWSSSSPRRGNSSARRGISRSTPLRTAGSGVCQLNKSTCSLVRCIFILSPCIAFSRNLVNELLPWHGALYITSLAALNSPYLPKICPHSRKKYRKIVLVESRNQKATVRFLKELKSLDLKIRVPAGKRRKDGKVWSKEYLEVYDWRILEAMAKVDRGKVYDYDPWKRNFLDAI